MKQKPINERINDHIRRLQLQLVPWLEYKGALETLAVLNKLSYPKMQEMLDDYKYYVLSHQKESEEN